MAAERTGPAGRPGPVGRAGRAGPTGQAFAGELLRARLTAQALSGPPLDDPVAVARRLLAIQAQDPRGARLAIRARTRGVTAAEIDHALTTERTLVLTWLARGTLHLVAAEDYPLLQALCAPTQRTAVERRLHQEGIAGDGATRGVAVIERALADEGPLTGPVLRERLRAAGVLGAHTGSQAFVHLLFGASLDGALVRGPMVGAEHAYARVADWLPDAPAVIAALGADRDRALAELARRYLAGHGPADAPDLARWAGIGIRDARAGLQAIAPTLRQRLDGLVELADAAPAARLPAPRLLGAFEPLLMGWRSRAEVLGEHEPAVVSGGIFRAFALVGGRAAATWRYAGAQVQLAPFGQLEAFVERALEREAVAVTRFLGA